MGQFKEVDGNLIKLAETGHFDVIVHGCNCFNTMGAGLAPQMADAFGCDLFPLEADRYRGDINKLGQIDYANVDCKGCGNDDNSVIVVNAYTQYDFGSRNGKSPVDYQAIALVMKKMNKVFAGKHIGLPKIGAGLAGGSWRIIKEIIKKELVDCDVTIVNYRP